MTEDVADGLQRGPVLEKMDRQRVAQGMWILEGNAKTAFLNPGEQSLVYGGRFQHPKGSAHSQENVSIRRWWRSALQMLHQRTEDFLGLRQLQRRQGLALVDPQTALSPIKVIEGKGYYLWLTRPSGALPSFARNRRNPLSSLIS